MRRIGRLVKTVRQSARRGPPTPEMMRAVGKILDDAMARIEEVLSGQKR